ncbi:MAG: 1,6-anhydro-N-acetylmuramyl-L-alanine amidase AmpD [Woeseiaceae bacterium]|nr:1,6-anhydro-N-acetylmuramyl-L-alanine amidase AmpD [Woeseiaceae bacterium]
MPELNVPSEYTVNPTTGLIEPARLCLSPNRDARPDGASLDMIVLHGISLPPGKFGGTEIEALFLNQLDWDAHPYFAEIRGMQVSAHLLIRRDGAVLQFVPFNERAWHAGESNFRGNARCNDFSIGIELEGEDETPYDDRQYKVLTSVLQALAVAYPDITPRELAGHCDIAPGRKSDPGPAFDWLRLYDALGETSENNRSCT